MTRSLACGAVLFATACSDDAGPGPSPASDEIPPTTDGAPPPMDAAAPEHAAVRAFWEAIHDERYDRLPDVIAGLSAAMEERPDDGYVTLIDALAHLWKIGEWDRQPDQPAPLRGQHALDAQALFEKAWEQAPDDDRIARWLGALQVRQGRVMGDQTLIDRGWATLERGIDQDPQLTFFARAMVLSDAPPGSAELDEAVATMIDNLDVCPPPGSGADVCVGTPKIPHRPEGFWLTAADILAKSGDVDRAREYYQNVQAFDSYATWRFRGLIEERLADVAGRVALYGDDDPSNDPVTVNRSAYTCTVCHAD